MTRMCPFTIVVDTREKRPYTFKRITFRRRGKNVPIKIQTVKKALSEGDYSILGREHEIAIERKSPQDLCYTVAHHRRRFQNELVRLQKLDWSAILVDDSWLDVMEFCRKKTRYNPKSLNASLIAFMQRYPKTHVVFRPQRWRAEQVCYQMLERWWKDHETV